MKTKYDMAVTRKPQVRRSDSTTEVLAGGPNGPKPGTLVPVSSFQALTFFDPTQQRQCIVLYALSREGIVYEFNAGRWNPYPITQDAS